eukprot:CAMPEP_0202024952 /NCGR_PEP_ID=MMETSP0905-20130828/55304_1 /ASSEMBLY_ACC=CAM_ASM_000554 /TAXON_ID=420261 /ORGANISM="Thalassiosira antarctica, Strain CCMP982" /LENGTH=111 /DNA_ID=CAMNT_0048587713 /DNA_START=56 /DNA_END=388 /DNA_ORIENTATION=+
MPSIGLSASTMRTFLKPIRSHIGLMDSKLANIRMHTGHSKDGSRLSETIVVVEIAMRPPGRNALNTLPNALDLSGTKQNAPLLMQASNISMGKLFMEKASSSFSTSPRINW